MQSEICTKQAMPEKSNLESTQWGTKTEVWHTSTYDKWHEEHNRPWAGMPLLHLRSATVTKPSRSIYLVMVSKLATSITPKEMKSLTYTASKLKKRQLPPSNDKSRGGEEPVPHGEAIRELQQESNARFHDRPTRRQYITAKRLREVWLTSWGQNLTSVLNRSEPYIRPHNTGQPIPDKPHTLRTYNNW